MIKVLHCPGSGGVSKLDLQLTRRNDGFFVCAIKILPFLLMIPTLACKKFLTLNFRSAIISKDFGNKVKPRISGFKIFFNQTDPELWFNRVLLRAHLHPASELRERRIVNVVRCSTEVKVRGIWYPTYAKHQLKLLIRDLADGQLGQPPFN